MENVLFEHLKEGDLSAVIKSTAAWTFLFFLCVPLPGIKDKSFDFQNRVVSIVHAVLSSYLAAVYVFFNPEGYVIGSENTEVQTMVITVSAGYFIYDFIACILHEKFVQQHINYTNSFHHISTLSGLLVGLYTRRSAAELGLCLLMMEISNPFMHMIQLFKELKMGDSTVAKYNRYIFALIFFIARIVLGPFLCYYTVVSEDSPLLVKAGGVGIMAISLVFFQQIIQSVLRSAGKSSKKIGEKQQQQQPEKVYHDKAQ